jgi:hypothetical protein
MRTRIEHSNTGNAPLRRVVEMGLSALDARLEADYSLPLDLPDAIDKMSAKMPCSVCLRQCGQTLALTGIVIVHSQQVMRPVPLELAAVSGSALSSKTKTAKPVADKQPKKPTAQPKAPKAGQTTLGRFDSNNTPLVTPSADSEIRPFQMFICDVFTIAGRGTVANGRIAVGSVQIGDKIKLANGSVTTTVIGIEMNRLIVDQANAGDEVGLSPQPNPAHQIQPETNNSAQT